MPPLYVTFYTTDPGYTAEAAALAETLAAHRLQYVIEGVPPFASWAAACQHKPVFIRKMMDLWPGRPLVWLDADARVVQSPDLFDALACDFAANWLGGVQLNSATLYLSGSASSRALVERWIERNTGNPEAPFGDQQNLQDVVEAFDGLRVERLPPEYAWIDAGDRPDISETHYGKREPVILQTQASRRRRQP